MIPEGLTVRASNYGPAETMDRLAAAVTARGMTISARIDHAAAAKSAGMDLRPTEVLIFGNPKAGTPLMQAAPTMAIALPLKALVWQDENGKTWLAYDNPKWLAQQRAGEVGANPSILGGMTDVLDTVAEVATR